MSPFSTLLRGSLLALLPLAALAQTGRVGINTTTPDASAALDVSSASKGLLVPRLTQAARLAMGTGSVPAPATGLLVYQTDNAAGFYYNAGPPATPNWLPLTSLTASNGLTATGGNVALGGTLSQNTTIATNGYNLALPGTGKLGLGNDNPGARIQVTNDNGGNGAIDDYIYEEYGPGDQAIYFLKANGTKANPTNLSGGEDLGNISFVPRYNSTFNYYDGTRLISSYRGTGLDKLTDLQLLTSGTERMRIGETGNVGIGVLAPQKRLHVDAAGDYVRLNNLATVPAATASTPLVIDAAGNVGQAAAPYVAGQLLRFGFDATGYGSAEQALRFGSNDSDAEMGPAPSTLPNFQNTITGATLADGVALAATSTTPARTTDQVTLPAGTYRVTVSLTGYYSSANSANGFVVKFIVNNAEHSIRFGQNSPTTVSGTTEVSELLTLSSASTLDFSLSSFAASFTVQNSVAVGSGKSYRSLVLVERLR